MNALILALMFQSLVLPPRISLENPAAVTAIQKQLKKDYDKVWAKFLTGKEDAKVVSDAGKLIKKQKDFAPALVVEAYIDLYRGNSGDAEKKLVTVIGQNPTHRIALYYLAELAYARNDLARASDLYTRLLAVDTGRPEIATKREKALLLATDSLLRSAGQMEAAGRLAEAESLYRQVLQLAPSQTFLHEKFASILIQQKKWDDALAYLRQEIDSGNRTDAVERHLAETLANLGRTEEARTILDQLRLTGSGDQKLETQVAELEDLGRWGADIQRFRTIEASSSISREQFAAMIVRYFPQMMEFRQSPQVITDIQNSWARPEIQTTVGTGLLDPLPNHTFLPARTLTRGELASTIARLSRLLSLKPSDAPPIPTADVPSGNVLYRDVQLALGYGLMSLDDSGNFGPNTLVRGEQAISTIEQLLTLSHEKANE